MSEDCKRVFIGDVGTMIRLDTCQDVSTGTDLKIYYKKPISGTIGSWTATLDSVDNNKIYYITQSGDLDEKGTWLFRSSLTLGSWSGSGCTAELEVYDPFDRA